MQKRPRASISNQAIATRAIILALLPLAVAACASRSPEPAALTEARALQLLEKSPAYRACQQAAPAPVSCVVNQLTPDEVLIDVGQMHPERFEPIHSFRITRDGRVYLYNPLARNDDLWQLDYTESPPSP